MSIHSDTPSDDDRVPVDNRRAAQPEATLRRIGEALHGLRYGSVLVIAQDGVVVQIERTEKTRLGR
jgi:hypothetical protein